MDVDEFFDRYTTALLARDAEALGRLYAVPALILFPDNAIAVTSEAQTEAFFASSWGQYDGVTGVSRTVTVPLRTAHSVWADVTWTYDGRARERFCYQLVGSRIAVLTPLTPDGTVG
jgi:hypothetical protein